MTEAETLHLLRLVRAYRPSQGIDEDTGRAWWDLLELYRFDDVHLALLQLVNASSAWITPDNLVRQVKVIRGDRITRYEKSIPSPPGHADDEARRAWFKDWRRRIGDGEKPPPPPDDEEIPMPPWFRDEVRKHTGASRAFYGALRSGATREEAERARTRAYETGVYPGPLYGPDEPGMPRRVNASEAWDRTHPADEP